MTQALLPGNQLHELIGALDIERSVIERARRRSRTNQALRRGSVFLERHEIARRWRRASRQIVDEIVDGARGLDVAMYRFLRGAHAVLGDAAIVAGQAASPIWPTARKSNRAPSASPAARSCPRACRNARPRCLSRAGEELPCDLSSSNLATLKLVGSVTISTLTLLVRRADRLRVRTVERHASWDRNSPRPSDRCRRASARRGPGQGCA